jgi:Tfp pilus assembly protein PilO
MNLSGHGDRPWTVGGAAGAAVMLAVGWFFFIGPQKAETGRLNSEAATLRSRAPEIQQRLADLRRRNADLPQYRAQLDRYRQALPTTPSLSDFLRETQVAGDNAGVVVGGFIVGLPIQVAAGGTQMQAVPITLTATGTTPKLTAFLDELQKVQPRAVLISSANLAPSGQGGSLAETVDLTLSLQVFAAPATVAEAPLTPHPAPS